MIQPLRHGSAPDRDQVRPRTAELLCQQLDRRGDAGIIQSHRNAITHERDQVRPHDAQLLFQSLERRESCDNPV